MTLKAVCSICTEANEYELYVFKTYKDRKGQAQQGVWTYAPAFAGTWSQTVPRDKEDSTWRFVLVRKTS